MASQIVWAKNTFNPSNLKTGKENKGSASSTYLPNTPYFTGQAHSVNWYVEHQFTPNKFTPNKFTPKEFTPKEFTPNRFTTIEFTVNLLTPNPLSS